MIDKSVVNISDNQRAVVEKYGFNLTTDEHKHYVLTDPLVRKANRGKGGKQVGGNLDLCLSAGVAEHKAHLANASAPSDKTDKQNVRAKTNPTKPNGAAMPPASDKTSTSQPEVVTREPKVLAAQTEPAKADSDASNASNELTRDDTSSNKKTRGRRADATAKAPRAKKVREKTERGPNRYQRVFSLIAANPSITVAELAKKADLSKAAAWIDVWNTAVMMLDKKGALKTPVAELVHSGE